MGKYGIFLLLVIVTAAMANPVSNLTVYIGDDQRWANEEYDSTGKTISEEGCDLVCWAMIMTQAAAANNLKDSDGKPVTYNPLELNNLLKKENAFVNGVIDLTLFVQAIEKDSAERDANNKGLDIIPPFIQDGKNGIPAILNTGQSVTPEIEKEIKALINKNIPVIVRVDSIDRIYNNILQEWEVTGRYPDGHSVLITGYDENGFTIVDPGGFTTRLDDKTYFDNTIYDLYTFRIIPEPATMLILAAGMVILRRSTK